jgi:tRNA-Thr(GGU) m(6)t(6)A37 methyltransferase TsaA
MDLTLVGHVVSDHHDPAATPPQASANSAATAAVVVRDDLVDALLGLDRYPHVWLLTWLHAGAADGPAPLQLVPRATEATGEVQGVFASRAPQRPNPIGLSLVQLLGVEGNIVRFAGVDLLDGTPVLDIKPWFDDCDEPASISPPG